MKGFALSSTFLGDVLKISQKNARHSLLLLVGLLFALFFQNCGGGGFSSTFSSGGSSLLSSENPPQGSSPGPTPAPAPTPLPAPIPPQLPAPVPVGGVITDLKIENTSASDQSNVPVTFGQVFSPGALPASSAIAGKLSDGTILPLQVDVKATHPDGSLRHAVISAIIPKLTSGQKETLSLTKASGSASAPPSGSPNAMLDAGFTTNVNVNLGGVVYSASADSLLKNGNLKLWLNGPIANEWLLSAPLKNSQGVAHPHLMARFAVRSYEGLYKAKVDVTIENGWAYEPGPQNFTYDVQIQIGGQTVYSKTGLTHYHHARWKKTFWWGGNPQILLKHNTPYLISTRSVANYDQSIAISPTALANLAFTGPNSEPMKPGFAMPEMPTVGGRPDIGLLPGWAVMYLLSMDSRAKDATLGMGDLAGTWSSHYRDKNTDRPVSIVDFPYMTILGNPGDTINPATGKSEAFPVCGGDCSNPNVADTAHQPSMAYLPYLVTGDFYYLEELQFWAMWNVFRKNPYYRGMEKGYLYPDEIRGVAWSLRTLAQVTYITPDSDPLKAQFETFLSNNLNWFNDNYPNNPNVNNALGILITGDGMIEYNGGLAIAPWQDDFFTSAIGFTAELGFSKAQSMLAWKAKFPVGRMNGPDFCWIMASAYFLNIRPTTSSPVYKTIGEVYRLGQPADLTSLACASQAMATYLNLKVGEMPGYSDSAMGFPSNMQPAIAYSADSGIAGGADAWKVFMARSVKPDYSAAPEFAIVPR